MSRVAKPVAVSHGLRARRIGIDTHYEAVVFMNEDCHVCRSEGFAAQSRVLLRAGIQQTIATLFKVTGDLVAPDEAALRSRPGAGSACRTAP
jgi:thymidine phosphorylase